MEDSNVVAELIKLYADNSGYFKDALDQAKTAMHISIAATIASFVIGFINNRTAKQSLKIQSQKAYREIITSERVKQLNRMIDICGMFYESASRVHYNSKMLNNLTTCKFEEELRRNLMIKYAEKRDKAREDYNIAETKLNMYLSENERKILENDLKELNTALNSSKDSKDFKDFNVCIDNIRNKIKKICDERWQEIEREAQIKL